ncbi:MAG: hypothetical protein H0V89_01020, partial [Deltaproteobacteria bacterium]|nr:hypothetical protein [Deltaproteobacteria bacterium]
MKPAPMRPIAALLFAGCLPGAAVRDAGSLGTEPLPVHGEPKMVDAWMICDVDDSMWTFRAVTDAWTDGGWVWLS